MDFIDVSNDELATLIDQWIKNKRNRKIQGGLLLVAGRFFLKFVSTLVSTIYQKYSFYTIVNCF